MSPGRCPSNARGRSIVSVSLNEWLSWTHVGLALSKPRSKGCGDDGICCGGSPGGLGTATCSRREGEEGKSGLEALPARRHGFATAVRANWLPTRFLAVVRTSQATRHRQHNRRKTRFSTPANREPITGSPGEATYLQCSDAVSLCARASSARRFPLSIADGLAQRPAAVGDWIDRRA